MKYEDETLDQAQEYNSQELDNSSVVIWIPQCDGIPSCLVLYYLDGNRVAMNLDARTFPIDVRIIGTRITHAERIQRRGTPKVQSSLS